MNTDTGTRRRRSLLTRDEERALALRVRAGDEGAARELAERNIGLAHYFAKSSAAAAIPPGDAMSLGVDAIHEAIRVYDPDRGRFAACAGMQFFRLVNEWRSEFTRPFRVPVSAAHAFGAIKRARAQIAAEHGDVHVDEVVLAERSRMSVKKVRIWSELAGGDYSVDASPEDGTGFPVGENLATEIVDRGERRDSTADMRVIIEAVLSELKPVQQMVLRNRFGLTETGDEMTLQEVSSLLGVTRERARQIEFKALKALRKSVQRFKGEARELIAA